MHEHTVIQAALTRRVFLAASGVGFAGLHLPALLGACGNRKVIRELF